MSGYLNNKGAVTPKFRRQGRRNPFRHILPGLIIVLGAIIAWYLVSERSKPVAPATEQPVAKTERQAQKPDKTPKPAEQPAAAAERPVEKKVERKNSFYKDGRVVVSSVTNDWNQIIDRCIMPDGKTRKVVRPSKPPIWTSASDQMLAHALSGTMDEDVPPLPISEDLEEDFVESLKTPIVINDDDTAEVREAKRRVIAAREYIDGEMRKGRSFYEVVSEHLAQRRSNSVAREEAMEIVSELKESGDAEMLYDYVDQVNEYFREHDIGEISIETNRKGDNQ